VRQSRFLKEISEKSPKASPCGFVIDLRIFRYLNKDFIARNILLQLEQM